MKTNVHVRNGHMVNWLADTFWLAKRQYEREQELLKTRALRAAKIKSQVRPRS